MRSFLRSDTWMGALVSTVLVLTAGVGAVVIDRHAEQHGHCPPLALIDVELAQRLQRDHGRDGDDVGHGCIVAGGSREKHVRRGRA